MNFSQQNRAQNEWHFLKNYTVQRGRSEERSVVQQFALLKSSEGRL